MHCDPNLRQMRSEIRINRIFVLNRPPLTFRCGRFFGNMGSGGWGGQNAKFDIPGVCGVIMTVKMTVLLQEMCLYEFLRVKNPRRVTEKCDIWGYSPGIAASTTPSSQLLLTPPGLLLNLAVIWGGILSPFEPKILKIGALDEDERSEEEGRPKMQRSAHLRPRECSRPPKQHQSR